MLIRAARLVQLAPGDTVDRQPDPVDVRIDDGRVVAIASHLAPLPGEEILDAEGQWLMPGLWDAHAHLLQWARNKMSLDLSAATGPEDVVARVAAHVAALAPGGEAVLGRGHRSALWPRAGTAAELDAVSGAHPVVLVSGDAHNGWLNSRAAELLGARGGMLAENEWFATLPRLGRLPGVAAETSRVYRQALQEAAALGVVGVVDFEFGSDRLEWPQRINDGTTSTRIRVATYPEGLADVVAAGLRTGDPIPGCEDLVTMGALKIITDGSLNTRTAFCFDAYAGAEASHGAANYERAELVQLMATAAANGLEVAAHAIGDAAVDLVLGVFEETGARGSIEHAQLVRREDVARIAALGLRASVQPAHLIDDRDVMDALWPGALTRCFPLRTLRDAGVELTLGSDAPVAPLDPWLAMAAAVHRSGDERAAWQPQEAITVLEALRASTDGQETVAVGSPADLVLLDRDPRAAGETGAAAAQHLRSVGVAATLVGGRLTYPLGLRHHGRHA